MLECQTRMLRDHFNVNNFLLINHFIGHDMYVETYNLAEKAMGPSVRIFNWAGSGNTNSVSLYEYMLGLHQEYGQIFVHGQSDMDISVPQTSEEDLIEVVQRELPYEPHYLRILEKKGFIGIQTFTKDENGSDYGPVVWLDKSLPKVSDQATNLSKVLATSKPEMGAFA
jgi:hypothetical protein